MVCQILARILAGSSGNRTNSTSGLLAMGELSNNGDIEIESEAKSSSRDSDPEDGLGDLYRTASSVVDLD